MLECSICQSATGILTSLHEHRKLSQNDIVEEAVNMGFFIRIYESATNPIFFFAKKNLLVI